MNGAYLIKLKTMFGNKIFKRKRLIVVILLLISFSNFIFSYDKERICRLINEKTSDKISKVYHAGDNCYIGTYSYDKTSLALYGIYIVVGDKFRWEHVNVRDEDYNYKYIELIDNASAFLADATFDGCTDIIWLKDFSGFPGFEIIKLDYDLKNEYLSFLSPDSFYGLGANPRITGPDYLGFNDFKFCIVNGKRGVRAYSIGKIRYDENKVYYALMNEDRDSHYFFFYWDKNEQRYILDESVTENQLKNAWCPEDYFAYNGLKFSKLDSKLIDADLKDLDKAQLRLMRNAVYARHGRTFKSVDLQSLWECYTWYKKNPSYNDDLLTDIDKYNIELIQKYEQK